MKKACVLLFTLLIGSAVFAAENSDKNSENDSKISMYAKATVGYYGGGASVKTDFDGALPQKTAQIFAITGFEFTPTFGLTLPVVLEKNFGTMKMGAEASIPLVFGKSLSGFATGGAFVINPGVMLIENYYFPETMPQGLQKLNAHVGVGFSVPISVVNGTYTTTNTTYGSPDFGKTVEKDFSATGVGFKLNFLLGAQYDFTDHISAVIDWNLGLFGVWSSSIRAGAVWRF